QSAESKKDFVHKLKIVLKELRENIVTLKIVFKAKLYKDDKKLTSAIAENNELISIFVKSVETAQSNLKK
ncbi:MAG: four helix bundle protein, partial [Chlorobi bacterium]|nr:four helix bundle protein [Chlorobiota bacterium]